MTVNKYTIHHLEISNGIQAIVQPENNDSYVLFWYRSVLLGERYISYQRVLDKNALTEECGHAIWPALSAYQCPVKPSREEEILSCCEKFISQLHPQHIPETCDLSVIICTRDRAQNLHNCLNALQRQICKPKEIIVVDNASSTSETRDVALLFRNVRYVREDKPGLDIARNTGVRFASGSIVAYTDDDTQPDPYWVFRIYETFQPLEVQAVTGLVIAGSLNTEAEIIFEKYWPFNRGYIPKLYDTKFFNATLPGGPPVWEIGAGANMAFRKSIFEDVGYFDERLDVGAAGCSGDSELWYRILANGYKIVYNPLAVVRHFHRTSLQGLKKQLYSYMKGFTVAILIQHQRFGHRGNLQHLFKVIPLYYLSLLRKGFPKYSFQYQTLFSELRGIFAGMIYYLKHRNTNARIYYGHDNF